MVTLAEAVDIIEKFEKGDLSSQIRRLESEFINIDKSRLGEKLPQFLINPVLMESAFVFKEKVSQINTLIHAVGIILSLPHILEEGETIDKLSIGAGNAGRPFDLETSIRIANYKFIHWQGGRDTIRQNSLFKDFYSLAEEVTTRKRCLYVLKDQAPLKFLNGGRAIQSVLSKNVKILAKFLNTYGEEITRVNQYYSLKKDLVEIVDISSFLPEGY